MQERTYWWFISTEVSLAVIPGPRGPVSKAKMRVKTSTGAYFNIVLYRPRLTVSIHSDLNELAANLANVTEVKCFREPCDGIVKCLVDIYREDGLSESISCEDIEGLPD